MDAQRAGGVLHGSPPLRGWHAEALTGGGVLTREDRHASAARDQLLQELQALLVEIRGHSGHPRDVRARLCEARNAALLDRIEREHHHNGDGPGSLLGGQEL
jgi:hypothetical protein